MRGCFACLTASHALSISLGLARAKAQIAEVRTSLAMSFTASKSPGELIGKPASITSTPNFSSCLAISSFSWIFRVPPAACSPSRRVVSKIITRSVSDISFYPYFFSQGIISRNSLPTISSGCSSSMRLRALNVGRPAWFSRIHSLAKVPS